MDEPLPVCLTECCRQTDGSAQKTSQIDCSSLVLLDEPIQGFATRILKNKDCSPLPTS
jgi:hypothetical protein